MKQRIVTGVLLSLLLAVLLCLPGWCFALAAMIAIGFSVWEEYHALTIAGHKPVSWPAWAVLICSIPLVILYIFTQRTFTESLVMSGSKE